MVAKHRKTAEVQIRVFRCSECSGYYIAVGTMERSAGSIIPDRCMFVGHGLDACSGQYTVVPKTDAARFLVELGKAVQA